jgi:hypothetical protein
MSKGNGTASCHRKDRADLIALALDGAAAHRLARRANALVLLDNGWSGEEVAKVLFVDTTRPGAGAGDTRKTGLMGW